jgi:basic membrane protein A
VIFHAAGTTGLGVFNAAKEAGIFAIGVDADQSDPKEYPGVILTSMLKRTDVAVFEVLKGAATEGGQFGGLREFGLADDGVGYAYGPGSHNVDLIPKEIIDQVEGYKKQIIAGEIKVPSE